MLSNIDGFLDNLPKSSAKAISGTLARKLIGEKAKVSQRLERLVQKQNELAKLINKERAALMAFEPLPSVSETEKVTNMTFGE